MENAGLIYQKIPAIMAEVEPIAKAKKNEQQGYKFRGIDDMFNALQSLFQKHQVFITTTVIDSKREERQTKSGGNLIYTVQKIVFRFCASDGSFVESTLEGEGMDSADKSTNKATSAAMKYALIQMFLIPTEEKKDSEHDDYDVKPKRQVTPVVETKPTVTKGKPGDSVKKLIPAEVQDAINKLANCDSLEDLTLLKETLELSVTTNQDFKNAGFQRYNQILNKKQ